MKEEPLNEMSVRNMDDSRRWFPSVHESMTLTGQQHEIMHFGFGAAGEAGEIVNKIKKYLGYGDQGYQYDIDWLKTELADEIADTICYLLDLGAALDIDIDRAVEDKRGICMGRWEPVRYTWDTVPIGHDVPGSGEIISKSPHPGGWHVSFKRTLPFEEVWAAFRHGEDKVPVAITSRGLIY